MFIRLLGAVMWLVLVLIALLGGVTIGMAYIKHLLR